MGCMSGVRAEMRRKQQGRKSGNPGGGCRGGISLKAHLQRLYFMLTTNDTTPVRASGRDES